MSRPIAGVRSFNRTVTQRIGVLEQSFLGRRLPLGHARLLYEIGHGPVEVRRLRRRLELDSGYVSRMLRALERRRLVTTAADRDDARVRVVRLTRTGRTELARLERLSDAAARSLLTNLSPAHRTRLVRAMSEVDRLLLASRVVIELTDPRDGGARACIARFFTELRTRFAESFEPERSLPANDDELTPPRGYLFVAWLGDRPVGCGALKLGGAPGIAEIKRMWVAPELRGTGTGTRLLQALEAQARRRRVRALRLETNRSLTEAQALYAAHGFREVAPFSDERYADFWFEKRLGPERRSSRRA